jgi:hypothetical protein
MQLKFWPFHIEKKRAFSFFHSVYRTFIEVIYFKNPFVAHAKKFFLANITFQFSVITLKIATIYPEISKELSLTVKKSVIL